MNTPRKKPTRKAFRVHWIRNNVPKGQRAAGHLDCPCRRAPESRLEPADGDVFCQCGRRYTWDGCIKGVSPAGKGLTAYTVYMDDGSEFTTSMSAAVTLADAWKYYVGRDIDGKRVVDVDPYYPTLKE